VADVFDGFTGMGGRGAGSADARPAPYLGAGTSSFADFLGMTAPALLPVRGGGLPEGGAAAGGERPVVPHGTTIIAAQCAGGVVMAGDRRATAGSMIAQRDIEKVFRTDDFSAVGISGSAGIGIDLARLFQVELEHYEKIEGRALSLEGKANRLAGLVRSNLGAAMQGFVVVPLFAGFDVDREQGRIFSYDPTGGRYEEHRYHSIGSGSIFARGALKKLYSDGLSAEQVVMICMEALYDAADDDSATGGPDIARRLYPMVAVITADGFERLTDEQSGEYAQAVVNGRLTRPDGPVAPLAPPGG
jgi:proteasome beta subunit